MSSEDRSDGVTTDRLDGVPIGVEYKSSVVVKTSVTGTFTTLFGLDVHEGFDSQRGQDGLIEYSTDFQIDDGKVNSLHCCITAPSKDTKTVINALIKQAHKLPRELYKSLTWDRGKELADHERISLDTDILERR